MAVNDVYRLSVDYTLATQVTSPVSGKTAFIPSVQLVGSSGTANLPASLGRKTAALSLAVVPAGMSYEAVAASDTDEPLGTTGAAGDYLSHIVIQPVTTGAGAVTLKDGASTIYLFTSGTLGDLRPITVPFGTFAVTGYSVTTGANVTVLAVGNFS